MLIYPRINPIAFSLGPLKIHWYGLMYLVGFVLGWVLLEYRSRRFNLGWKKDQISDLIFYAAMGVIIGGRLGYVIFYDFFDFIHAPWIVFKLWEGGMSFHGGLVGVILAMIVYCKKYKINFFDVTDQIVIIAPLGLAAGRLGNFINGELWGRIASTPLPWAMIYPEAGPIPRHPSELYEFLLEGILLFIIMWIFANKKRPRMATSGLFLLLYGCFRFFVEFFRQPDSQLGFLAFHWATMGMILSAPMILAGAVIFLMSYHETIS
jgi:phosphatidylglycerol:prolipoprotein diacylglycerol transferase